MSRTDPTPTPRTESLAAILARPALVVAVLLGMAWAQFRPAPAPKPDPIPPPAPAQPAPAVAAAPAPTPEPEPEPARPPTPPEAPPAPAVIVPPVDREAVARAEADLDAASRDRARAEDRLAAARRALEVASTRVADAVARGRTLSRRVVDPSARIGSADAKVASARAERDRLAREVDALEKVEPPRARAILAKSAVARPTQGTEYHFEVRRNRVAFIDLDRLVDLVKADARLRMRAGGAGRGTINSLVGPVGSFSLRYRMARAVPDDLADLLDAREVTYNLQNWEVIPEGENRGDGIDSALAPVSEYGRALRRLNPDRDTVTLWVYPDGFALYRVLRDDLHARGFTVAARPLPAGMPIRGSPSGSLSAGQ